ncbi:MAG: hypothetical protein EOP50_01055 [Sphingobacteriales bacterium]|nr:MAG: hypothetical protein EOP50_01055 [Sphingobacteriales bacterium]
MGSANVGEGSESAFGDLAQKLSARASTGDADALFELGQHFENGAGDRKNDQEALRCYRLAAERGHKRANTCIGRLLEEGRGGPADLVAAAHHYHIAADADDSLAQNNLGLMFRYGRGVAQDYRKAVYWMRRAAKSGHARGQANYAEMLRLGLGRLRNRAAAVRWYRKAADQGLASAQNSLGLCYRHGEGIFRNRRKATQLFLWAAEQGNAPGQTNLGWALENGEGIQQDAAAAVRWYEAAAAQGNGTARNNLGCMLRAGIGCAQDSKRACSLFLLAIDGGDELAITNLGEMLETGNGCEANLELAVSYYRRAAKLKQRRARVHLLRRELVESLESDPVSHLLSYLGLYPALLMAIGGLSTVDIAEKVLAGSIQWSAPFEIIMEGYRRISSLIGAIFEPIVVPVIGWVETTFGWTLHLQDHWRSIFLLAAMPFFAMTRAAMSEHIKAESALRDFGKVSAATWRGIVAMIALVAGNVVGSVAAGLIPIDGSWWLQALAAGLPWATLAAVVWIVGGLRTKEQPFVLGLLVFAGCASAAAALIAIVHTTGAGAIALGLLGLLFGCVMLFSGLEDRNKLRALPMHEALPKVIKVRSSIAGGLVLIGGFLAATCFVASNWIVQTWFGQ